MQISRPWITELERQYVLDALKGEHLSDGVLCTEFEQRFAKKFGYEHVVALNSGTSALHAALLALGVGSGDEVLVTPYTFVASVNVVLAVGATPVFVDIDRSTYCMSPGDAAKKRTSKTKACIPVDVFGVPCDILALKTALPGVLMIQDSIEAIGSKYRGEYVGKHADIACFGFFPNKQMTTAEGGIAVTSDPGLAKIMARIAQHGATRGDPQYVGWGLNFRLSDLHAALGLAQLERLDSMQKVMQLVKNSLNRHFGTFRKQVVSDQDTATDFNYTIELPRGVNKQQFIARMGELGVPVKPYFNSLKSLPHLSVFEGDVTVAEIVASSTVSLPFHWALLEREVQQVAESFQRVIKELQ